MRVMLSLVSHSQADVIRAFNDTLRYFNIDNHFFDNMVQIMYPRELWPIKANTFVTSAAFLNLDLSIDKGVVSSKKYNKRDDFDFSNINVPFLDGNVPRARTYGIYISQLFRFSRACSSVGDFNSRNLNLTEKLLKQGYRFHKLKKSIQILLHKSSTYEY